MQRWKVVFRAAAATVLFQGACALANEPAVSTSAPSATSAPADEISQAAFTERWAHAHPDLTLVDVRSAEEFAAGHLPGAINIPIDQLETRMSELKWGNEIVVYCLSGVRSARAIELLRAREFMHIEHLVGDYSEWESSGGPIETAP